MFSYSTRSTAFFSSRTVWAATLLGRSASRVATEEILSALSTAVNDLDETWPEHWDPALSAPANSAVDAVVAGHHRVTREMQDDADLKGMGTTVVVAVHQTNR